jgi:hypothetical protein
MTPMKTNINVERQIHELQLRAERSTGLLRDFDKYRAEERAIREQIKALSASAGKGLAPGKHLRWQVADGYAEYIVSSVGKTACKLAHIPLGDGYRFMGVDRNGNCLTSVVKAAVEGEELMVSLFGER